MKEIAGGVTAPEGFLAAGVVAGIRKKEREDFAVVYSQVPAKAAAVYTLNKFKAAPLQVTENHLAGKMAQAFVINSGIANAGMGEVGLSQAEQMSAWAAEALAIDPNHVVVASTGVIGMPLPMEKIELGIKKAAEVLSHEGGAMAAKAIMTTDLVVKEMAVAIEIGGEKVTIGAMAKGSGMINPNMATMLGFITTDVKIEQDALEQVFKSVIDESFNMISVDGDTSTNDMVAIMANNLAKNLILTKDSQELGIFQEALLHICREMAKKIARDGEGATKLIEATVTGAGSVKDARLAAKAVIASSLVKTAIYGEDANWGRIACALGYSGAEFDPSNVSIAIGDVVVACDGMGQEFDEAAAKVILAKDEVALLISLGKGDGEATAWGCDLTYDYIKINADYRS